MDFHTKLDFNILNNKYAHKLVDYKAMQRNLNVWRIRKLSVSQFYRPLVLFKHIYDTKRNIEKTPSEINEFYL